MGLPLSLPRWEYRDAAELRAGTGRTLSGYAAIFGAKATIGRFTETIAPGAFQVSLGKGTDILALVDHDSSKLLARTKSGTLRLSEDVKGLAFALSVPNTTLGADILEMAQRGDLGGASFSFRATNEHWNGTHRELRAVELYEISVVQSFPAYVDTSVYARSHAGANRLQTAILRRLFVETL